MSSKNNYIVINIAILDFINENIGKDYGLSIGKLTTLVSCIKPKI